MVIKKKKFLRKQSSDVCRHCGRPSFYVIKNEGQRNVAEKFNGLTLCVVHWNHWNIWRWRFGCSVICVVVACCQFDVFWYVCDRPYDVRSMFIDILMEKMKNISSYSNFVWVSSLLSPFLALNVFGENYTDTYRK